MQTILHNYQSLKAARAPWESWWETLRHYVLPDRQHNQSGCDTAEPPAAHQLSDTTAVEACQKLASAHMNLENLIHLVGYINKGHTLCLQVVYNGKKLAYLPFCEG